MAAHQSAGKAESFRSVKSKKTFRSFRLKRKVLSAENRMDTGFCNLRSKWLAPPTGLEPVSNP